MCWVNIPKCGSSFMQKVLYDFGWNEYEYAKVLLLTDIQKVTILRDPIERWVSGFSEYALHHQWIENNIDDENIWDLILSNPVFDDHTQFQHQFFDGVSEENLVFIYMQDNAKSFYTGLENWCNIWQAPITDGRQGRFAHWEEKQNPAQKESLRWSVNQKIKTILKNDKPKRTKLRELHKQDYLMMDRIQRIGITN
jgi:hypothetical protein